ncbi:MAG TPA: 3,4-dihydroxy-2-butanone-4-phosphate synthase [Gammaproteobacteria bacterium]|nr:3,4-dihydroxy-2-butanone-4-phosphate synthase [Gammaproteobacteria bacterium]
MSETETAVAERPAAKTSGLDGIEDIIADIRAGRMVVIMDDEDRENEGDLVMAASCVRAQDVNFMARYGRGLICLTLTPERCRQLRLPLMVSGTDAKHLTNFTVSIEAARGVTTGISAADRAVTIQAAVAPEARPEDLVQPGHVFPLMAQPGGVLARAGHTEAGCDLARLAGFEPAAVIVEILNEDGSMARRPQLEAFARHHGLRIGTIADLIRYRMEHEQTVERVAESPLETALGPFRLMAYRDNATGRLHLALVHGEIRPEAPVLVRVHMEQPLEDLFDVIQRGRAWSLRAAMARVVAEGSGIIVVLRCEADAGQLLRRMEDYRRPPARGASQASPATELRSYGVGAQILVDLGVRRMRVLGSPLKLHALSGFGLDVIEYIGDEP